MSKKVRKDYKPFLATDKEYLKKVARAIKQKAPLEDIPFHLLNDALSSLGITDNPYDLIDPDNLRIEAVQLLADRSFKIIQDGISNDTKDKLRALWDYLCEADSLQIADLIFVFGGGGETRPKEAAKLYKEGWAPKILFTGQKASYMEDVEMTEAEAFAQIAGKEGVPTEDIILEKEALNTVENATKSVALLKQQRKPPSRVILIQIAYQMRRAYLTFKAAADWNPKLIKHPALSAKFKREDYFMSRDGWSYVFFEFIKLYGARLMKHF
ncbi:MAG: YdcF family protein [Candidatus Yanofskybacteria bacterium]|nr:YdcF family protein [Candidatus Yanofskybacteria bacterium]